MRITNEQLRRIIKEEIDYVLDEAASEKMKQNATLKFTLYPSSYQQIINQDNIQGIEGSEDVSFHKDYDKVVAKQPFYAKFTSSLGGTRKTFSSKENREIYNAIYNASKINYGKQFDPLKNESYQALTDLFFDGMFGDIFKGVSLLPEQFEFETAIGLDGRPFRRNRYEAAKKDNPLLYKKVPFKPAQNQTTGDTNE